MVAKIRPNVMVALMCGAVLTGLFGWWLIDRLDSGVSTEILAMLVGIGVGGLFTLAGLLAHDPPPPSVPASTHESALSMVLEREQATKNAPASRM